MRKYFFALQTIDMWNVLSNDIIRCKNSHMFTKNTKYRLY